ncbi:MAG: hypothetical protein C0490_08295 [Marivirga sp.]|nr:hypothetical protein [Marivirga sp.]
MNRKITCIFLMFTCTPVLSQNRDIERVRILNQRWLNSYEKKDAGTLNEIFANDFILTAHNGKKMTKIDILQNLNLQKTTSVSIDSIDIRLVTRRVALVTAYSTFALDTDGKKMTGQNCYQDVYVKKKNKWLAVAAHVTLLNFK